MRAHQKNAVNPFCTRGDLTPYFENNSLLEETGPSVTQLSPSYALMNPRGWFCLTAWSSQVAENV